ncbi:MAG TPA: phosphodiester glycosidase family protein, partial [Kofleriaceae bacterium]|nr:phosphodiester glycosidase family protein [Kofleriaceae bacterium]
TADATAPAQASVATPPCDGSATALAPGLTRERWPLDATPAIAVTPCLELVRADLAHLRPRLVTASRDGAARPAPAWLAELHLAAAVNAGMFLDGGHSIGLLVDGDHVDQPRDNPKLGGFLAFGPREPGAPPVVLEGRDCPGFDLADLRRRYRTVTQSYRLLGCDGAAIPWADDKAYSAAAIALDRAGRLVLVHVRAPLRMRDLARALAEPRLGLTAAIFVEGGPEATVAVAGDQPLLLVGSYETGFVENDDNHDAWALPNLVALAPR